MDLHDFIVESNRIEGINRPSTTQEVIAHEDLLALSAISVQDVEKFVDACAGAPLRRRAGMNVYVGNHVPPPGGPEVEQQLKLLLADMAIFGTRVIPAEYHQRYETLHPFMDGNGRSGRALWAWQRLQRGESPFALGFLWSYYYETLQQSRYETEGP